MTQEDKNTPDPNPGGADSPAFANCKYLRTSYGNEENFRAVAGSEIGALDTSKLIVDFLKAKAAELAKAAGGKALNWVTAELLKAFAIGSSPDDLEEIKSLLKQIVEMQKQILDKLDVVLLEVQYQSLITQAKPYVTKITNVYDQLKVLSTVTNPEERERRAAEIKRDILDSSSGMLISLRVVSDVLIGKDPIGQNEPLIKLFADRWFNSYQPTRLNEGVPLSRYYRPLDQWLHEMTLIQYMGLSALANARIANGDFETLQHEIDDVVKNMEEQQRLLGEQVPSWIRTLPEEVLTPDSWFVIRAYGINGRSQTDDSQVMYGPPQSDLSKTVRFRGRNWWNWDEEWNFEKVDKSKSAIDDDVYKLVVRTANAVLVLEKQDFKIAYKASDPNRPRLRLVMGRSLDPNVTTKTPRRDAYIPVMGLVGRSDFVISKISSGTPIAVIGPEDKAIRFHIVRP